MDFMDMREALDVAGCPAANGNAAAFYGAWPGATGRGVGAATAGEKISRHAIPAASIGCDPRIASWSKRKPG